MPSGHNKTAGFSLLFTGNVIYLTENLLENRIQGGNSSQYSRVMDAEKIPAGLNGFGSNSPGIRYFLPFCLVSTFKVISGQKFVNCFIIHGLGIVYI